MHIIITLLNKVIRVLREANSQFSILSNFLLGGFLFGGDGPDMLVMDNGILVNQTVEDGGDLL